MNFLGRYSNGWGHTIVTLAIIVGTGITVLLNHDPVIQTHAYDMMTIVVGYWFGSSSANIQKEKPLSQVSDPAASPSNP